MNGSTPVTTLQPFGLTEGLPLFCINAGVPTDDALEQASNLMACVEAMAAADGFPDKQLEATAIQYLSEAAKAIVLACRQRPVHGAAG